MFRATASLIVMFLAAVGTTRSAVSSAAPAPDPPPEVRALVARSLGDGAEILRYGHLSTPDSLEVIGAIPATGIPHPSSAVEVSRLALLRQEGNKWVSALSVSNGIRNNDGAITEPKEKSPVYQVTFFQHRFDDGRQRWILQFTPINKTGDPSGLPIHVSWNEMLGRYQRISVEGYGFQPEFHGEAVE